MTMSDNVKAAQYGNKLMEDHYEQKRLSFNLSKSQFLVMGNKSARRKVRRKLEENPLTLCGEVLLETKAPKLTSSGVWFSSSLDLGCGLG